MAETGLQKPAVRPSARRLLTGLSRVPEELGVFAALVVLVLLIGVHNSAFIRHGNLLNLIASNSFFGIISLATVFLLALGEIDLSVGWNFNFSAVIAALAMV